MTKMTKIYEGKASTSSELRSCISSDISEYTLLDIENGDSDFDGPKTKRSHNCSSDDIFSSNWIVNAKLSQSTPESLNNLRLVQKSKNKNVVYHEVNNKDLKIPVYFLDQELPRVHSYIIYPMVTAAHIARVRKKNEKLSQEIEEMTPKGNSTNISNSVHSIPSGTKNKTSKSKKNQDKGTNTNVKKLIPSPSSENSLSSEEEGSPEHHHHHHVHHHHHHNNRRSHDSTRIGKCWLNFKKTKCITCIRGKWTNLDNSETLNSAIFVFAVVFGLVILLCVIIFPIMIYTKRKSGGRGSDGGGFVVEPTGRKLEMQINDYY